MPAQISKDADKMLSSLYKEYLRRRKSDMPKYDSKNISSDYFQTTKPFCDMPFDDVLDTMVELQQAGYLEMDLGGNCFLKDKAITYMENRFKNGLSDALSFLAQFLP